MFRILGIMIALSLVQFSCGSSKKSAVPCPDFSHSRNMKSRRAQLNITFPDHHVYWPVNA